MIADYHIHTKKCHHAFGEMEDYVRVAVSKGFEEIGFSDHAPALGGYDPAHRMDISQFSEYVHAVQKIQQQFPQINIRLGIETDFYKGFEPFLEWLLKEFPVEYVIGSVHFIDHIPIFHTDQAGFSSHEKINLVRKYFTLLKRGVGSGLVDIVGHLDLVKWLFPDTREEIINEGLDLLKVIAELGIVLELNTSGLRKQPGEMYPSSDLLNAALDLGIPICLGSDAHRPGEVGANFKEASMQLQSAKSLCSTTLRKGLQGFIPEDRFKDRKSGGCG